MDFGLDEFSRDYHGGNPLEIEDFHNRELMVYKFKFYKERADIILTFYNSQAPLTLLGLITDCLISPYGLVPASSIS